MKKLRTLLALLIALCLLVAFSGCKKNADVNLDIPDDNPVADTPGNESEQPEENPKEEPEDEPKRVLAVHMNLADAFWQVADDVLAEKFAANGVEYTAVSGEGDPIKQIEQIENGVVQGYDLIIVIPLNGEAVADACQKAMDDGVYIYSFINDSVYNDVYRTTDAAYSGEILARHAAEWALEHFPNAEPGSINTVLVGQDMDSHTKARWDAMQETVKEYPELNVLEAVTIEESVTDGQAKAENVLTMHPNEEIHLWIVGSGPGAIGVNAAIMAENSGVDYKEDVCVVGNSITDEVAGLMRSSLNNESVYRICVATGARLDANMGAIVDESVALLNGEAVDAYSPVNVDLVTVDNLAEFGY